MYVTFLSLNKKVTKEISIGEALRKGALPYVPHPPPRQNINQNLTDFDSSIVSAAGVSKGVVPRAANLK